MICTTPGFVNRAPKLEILFVEAFKLVTLFNLTFSKMDEVKLRCELGVLTRPDGSVLFSEGKTLVSKQV